MNNERIYIVVENWYMDCNKGQSIEVFDTLKKAQKVFDKKIKDARTDMSADYNGDDIIEETGNNLFEIWEDGNYFNNHIEIKILEKEVL